MSNIQSELEFVKANPETPLLSLYRNAVPPKPYTTNELGNLYITNKEIALHNRYIQHNPPFSVSTLIIDVDDSESHYKWDDNRAPPPNLAIMNQLNGHSHLAYFIQPKIYKNSSERLAAYKRLCHDEQALIKMVGGDPSYSNLISKNPYNEHWKIYEFQPYTYDLEYLEQWLPERKRRVRQVDLFTAGLGRNCTLFEEVRHLAYAKARYLKFEMGLGSFMDAVYYDALQLNTILFKQPLFDREVWAIAKSIARWSFNNLSKEGFSAIQSRRGKKSGAVRAEKANQLYKEIKEIKLKSPLLSNREIGKLLNVSKDTVRNALAFVVPTTDDSELFDDTPTLF